MDILDRASAPLSAAEWKALDDAMIKAVRQVVIGRRMIELQGPLGPGVYTIPYSVFCDEPAPVEMDLTGDQDAHVVSASVRKTIELPALYQDFKLMWRDIQSDRKLGTPFDTSAAAVAAANVAGQEDRLIFQGDAALGMEGLMTADGSLHVPMSDWSKAGTALSDVVKAISALSAHAHFGPYALAVSPVLYGQLIRAYANTGLLEIDQVKALVADGIYVSNALSAKQAVVVETGARNMSLVVGQDISIAYLGAENMNHPFRILETAALVIRRPSAICTIA